MKVAENIRKFFLAEGINVKKVYIYNSGVLIPANERLMESLKKEKKLQGYFKAIKKDKGFIIEIPAEELKKLK